MKIIKLSAAMICSCLALGTHGFSQGQSIGEVASKATQHSENQTKISNESVSPGTHVYMGGKKVKLHKGSIKLGDNFSSYAKELGIKLNGVAIVNIVPSIDTPVCEEQSHIIGESSKLNKGVQKIVVSRDTPMAQERFAKEAKLENITYGSDFKFGSFGKKTGLLMKGSELLARAVLVLDSKGRVVHMQVVKDVVDLPNMDLAFKRANSLVAVN